MPHSLTASCRLRISGPDGGELPVAPGASVLETVHRHHWQASAGCLNGICLACRAQLVAGCASDRQGRALQAGPILACQTIPLGDLQLDWASASAPGSASAARQLNCRILASDGVPNGYRSRLELPAGRMPPLLPGQWLQAESHRLWIVGVPGGARRELLVLSGEPLAEPLSGSLPESRATGQPRLTVAGPFGHCWLDATTPAPVQVLADEGRQLQAAALRQACSLLALEEGQAMPPATVLGLSDDREQRSRWRTQWQGRAALYADDDGRSYRPGAVASAQS